MADNRGMTLIELLIVVSIIGILVVVLGFQYAGWMGRYKVETQVRAVYADLADARLRAMQQNMPYGINFAGDRYQVIRATDEAWTSFTGAPGWTTVKMLSPYQIPWTGMVVINTRGLVSPDGVTLRVTGWSTSNPPDYTCILLGQTKINMGWTTPQNDISGQCIAK